MKNTALITGASNGIGLGLFIQAGFMLLLDFFAESRGKTYIEVLQTIT